MTVLVVGLSHRSAPVDVLERAAVAAADVPKLVSEMLRGEHVSEAMLVSTCNRVEVYAVVDAFHGGLADVSAVLERHTGMALPELTEHVYVHYAGSAVQHLFAVAAGLDSMVVGEAQILGQLRDAYSAAAGAGTVGRVLHELAQQALRVGKRVHADTGIDTAGASVVSEALADADARARRARGAPRGDRRCGRDGRAGRGAPAPCRGRRDRRAQPHARQGRAARRDHRRARHARPRGHARGARRRAPGRRPAGGVHGRGRHGGARRGRGGPRDGRPLAVCDLGLPHDVDPAVADAARTSA